MPLAPFDSIRLSTNVFLDMFLAVLVGDVLDIEAYVGEAVGREAIADVDGDRELQWLLREQ